jgi:hypothetical protein
MTNRRTPTKRTTATDWKPSRPRSELLKAIGGAGSVVVLTVLLIFLMKPGDTSSSNTPLPAPVTTPSQPAGDTTASLPADSTTTVPQGSPTPAQP